MISHSFWIRQFAGQPDTVGRSLTIDGRSATVVGIFPPGFDLPFAAEIWVPLQVAIDTLPLQDRWHRPTCLSHGLRPGVAIDRANQEIAAVVKALADEYPQRRGWTYRAIGLRQQLLGDLDGRTTNRRARARGGRFLLVICW